MFEEEDRETGFALFLVIALAITVSIFTIGMAAGTAISQGGTKAAATGPVVTRLYFDLGKAEIPVDASAALSSQLAGARQGRRVQISGYHDASGDAAANEELAKQRAFAVRDWFVDAGVPGEQIELLKPALTTGGGDPREARRVEVTLH
jgi:outer membrane protein OmpA-like peptidoglycan-associated protein